MSNDIAANRSGLKDFLASIATISGDLSNITAPPFVLAENSTVEIPQYWADHPYLWAAPALEEDPEKRALLVLKNFLCSLRGQQYAGRKEEDGVKKPLNAFLGELFLGSWNTEELGETRLVSEQVGHHPPVTACYLWNDQVGIRAEGFTEQEITFSGNVSIKQKGYAIVHVDKYDEDYLLPLPNIKVKGLLGGVPHPELYGEYSLISSNGYISHIKFEGKSFFGSGHKNGFEARFFHADRPDETIYTIEGAWNSTFTIKDARNDSEVETFDVRTIKHKPMTVPDLSEQDPWESRKAWSDVISSLHKGDMKGATTAKNAVENGQRQMRKDEEAKGEEFKHVFFNKVPNDPIFDKLVKHDPQAYTIDPSGGIWKVDKQAAEQRQRPFHGDLTPSNQRVAHKQGQPQEGRRSINGQDQDSGGAAGAVGSAKSSNGYAPDAPVQNVAPKPVGDATPRDEKRPDSAVGSKGDSRRQSSNAIEVTDEMVENFLRAKTSNLRV
ncbi:hypothetical protein CC77DRAFT_1020627 [Alternaria alternata]|uniref:Oxysterol-binding protein n=1 Tax=Alternaria alternata TaxID=5599 RepID=A0A177DLQ5_ALTAL|nr:hypothetical protein CC77DRAFT_1020627 [Alternaria alternata]OAG20081.1 hypothetical protein CC77DRAFT_1020627 [Alternaria alternata]